MMVVTLCYDVVAIAVYYAPHQSGAIKQSHCPSICRSVSCL